MAQDQVKLPFSVAIGVVMQGIRIRFGRSVVTVMGVVFGIAFLMSILTSQVVKSGVGQEDQLRTEARRMYSFLTAEMGSPFDRTVGVVQIGPLSDVERRFLSALEREGLREFRWFAAAPGLQRFPTLRAGVVGCGLEEVATSASAVLVVGQGKPEAIDWEAIFQGARQSVLGLTRQQFKIEATPGISVVTLERELKEDEIAKIESEKRKARFRSVWIICVSLVVTVMGISNAMLMSVTERFREIGTMKCLGALSAFIRRLFLIESSLMGIVGGLIGSLLGAVFSLLMYSFIYGFGLVFASLAVGTLLTYLLASLLAGLILSVVAAIYPASVASAMVPADALRSNI
jgi:hypothetical protein